MFEKSSISNGIIPGVEIKSPHVHDVPDLGQPTINTRFVFVVFIIILIPTF